jgi:putative peptidoglycan lipid II flippase
MVSNTLFALLFVGVLLSLHFKGPHTGLALASTVAAYLNASMLFRGLRRQGVYQPEPGWAKVMFAVALACIAMVALMLWQHGARDVWLLAPMAHRVRMLALLLTSSTLVYLAVLFSAGLRKHHLEKGGV